MLCKRIRGPSGTVFGEYFHKNDNEKMDLHFQDSRMHLVKCCTKLLSAYLRMLLVFGYKGFILLNFILNEFPS